DTLSSTRSTGTFLCGEIARNQSGRLSGSIWRNSKAAFFSRSTMAARCTHGQVLKLTRRYLVMISRRLFSPERSTRGIQPVHQTEYKPVVRCSRSRGFGATRRVVTIDTGPCRTENPKGGRLMSKSKIFIVAALTFGVTSAVEAQQQA